MNAIYEIVTEKDLTEASIPPSAVYPSLFKSYKKNNHIIS